MAPFAPMFDGAGGRSTMDGTSKAAGTWKYVPLVNLDVLDKSR
ncbi:hypothetical protein HDG37_000169 [Paraburkholderia sp. MM5384-R2]|nr:hypothetical protein [Paraburkholderia sp. MM5384-R2]